MHSQKYSFCRCEAVDLRKRDVVCILHSCVDRHLTCGPQPIWGWHWAHAKRRPVPRPPEWSCWWIGWTVCWREWRLPGGPRHRAAKCLCRDRAVLRGHDRGGAGLSHAGSGCTVARGDCCGGNLERAAGSADRAASFGHGLAAKPYHQGRLELYQRPGRGFDDALFKPEKPRGSDFRHKVLSTTLS